MKHSGWPTTEALIDVAMSSASLEEYRRRCLELLAPAVGCEAALMQWAVPGRPMNTGGRLALDLDTIFRIGDNLGRYMNDGLGVLMQETAKQTVTVDEDVLGSRGVANMSVTREVVAPLGLGSALSAALPVGTHGQMVLAVFFRRAKASPYAHSIQQRLKATVPVLAMGELAVTKRSEQPKDFNIDLTGQEWELVEWVRRGHGNREIALVLGVAPYTVRNRLSRLYRKLHVGSRNEMLFALGLLRD